MNPSGVSDHAPSAQLAKILADDPYLRERLTPQPGDSLYLHLSDLLLAIQSVATEAPLRILDFGCGGSPYRSLFPMARYERADIAGAPGLDYHIPTGGAPCRLPVPDDSYDLILSSQVLEHVPEPAGYLVEAHRLLRPGGRLVLTTHGIFEDHGCPYDFRRWTSDGLRMDVERSGLRAIRVVKLSTGPRAIMHLLRQHSPVCSRKHSLGVILWLLRKVLDRSRASFDRQCDRAFGHCRIVEGEQNGHSIYVGLFCVAEKPAA